jgi:2'-5' RNA ligase
LWAGIDRGKDELAKLARVIDEACAQLGFEPERRDYHPHVTFARMKSPGDASGLLLPFSEDTFRKSKVARVVLFESVTEPKGAVYSSRVEWPLVP